MTNKETAGDQGDASMDMNKMMHEFWETLFKPWNGMFSSLGDSVQSSSKGRMAESFQTNMKVWQTMMESMSDPSMMGNFQKATAMTPDLVLGFTQTCLQSFTNFQTQAGEWISKRGSALSTADIQELDKELIKSLNDSYEKEFRKYLKLPQLGLSRLYQERALEALDKLNNLQLKLSEFLHMLYVPLEKSLNSLQKEMVEMSETGSLDDKSKTYYNLWIKLLEGHYMELFKQPEYADVMGGVLYALSEFNQAKQAVVNDCLKQSNIPTNKDMDDLSKELYLLKKRVRALEQK